MVKEVEHMVKRSTKETYYIVGGEYTNNVILGLRGDY